MTTSVLLRTICSITIFSNEVFPLPHAPYRPTVKEVGKADCNITLVRLFANDSRFSLSSEDFIMGRSGLIINTTSQYLNNLYHSCHNISEKALLSLHLTVNQNISSHFTSTFCPSLTVLLSILISLSICLNAKRSKLELL